MEPGRKRTGVNDIGVCAAGTFKQRLIRARLLAFNVESNVVQPVPLWLVRD